MNAEHDKNEPAANGPEDVGWSDVDRGRAPLRFGIPNGTRFVRQCAECRARYANWASLSLKERRARMRPKPRTGIGYMAALVIGSKNRKLGGIPVSMTDMASCPDACPLRDAGPLGAPRRRRRTPATRLPGRGDELDVLALESASHEKGTANE